MLNRFVLCSVLCLSVFGLNASARQVGVSLTSDVSSSQPVGLPVTWTATASGGTGPYQYCWFVSADDGVTWVSLSACWTSANTLQWKPTEPDEEYLVAVWVDSADPDTDRDDATSRPFTITATHTFSTNPNWTGVDNGIDTAPLSVQQDFVYRTGQGEAGGLVTRSLKYDTYYAKVISPSLSLDNRLRARGHFRNPAPPPVTNRDRGTVYIGWFNDAEEYKPANFIGFRLIAQGQALVASPRVVTSTWRAAGDIGTYITVVNPDQIHYFDLQYEPTSEGGLGAMQLKLDDLDPGVSVTLPAGFRTEVKS